MELPKIVFTDIDGVWTDGGMYYDQLDNEWKKFNTRDSAGVLYLRYLKIPLVILTGEDTRIMARRAEKLKIEHCFQGVKNKLMVAQQFCQDRGVELRDCGFIGDDWIDLPLLKAVKYSACPLDAADIVKQTVQSVMNVKGGDGAFRAYVEFLIEQSGKWDSVRGMFGEP